MGKILISWYAYNNDFMMEQRGNKKGFMGHVNESGPTFNVHRHFWDESGFSKHFILNRSKEKEDVERLNLLVEELKKTFSKRRIEILDVKVEDVINVSEIFAKLQPILASMIKDEVEVFISPGTPAMQTAWYLLGSHFKKNLTLFQLRDGKFTSSNLPEKILVSLDNSILPTNIVVAQQQMDKEKPESDILITESLKPIYQKALMISRTDNVGCLILGENGTGKENLASYIHQNSNRQSKPFITVNCAAYSDDLLRSELFGHEKGSFTGADSKKVGVFEAANGGTVFLDEIGDVSPKMQVSLLRVLQSKQIQPVGSVKNIDVDVRVIAATNRDLEKMSEENEFRIDLFYRLAVTELKLPPLRERGKKEILDLMEHFNAKFSMKFIDRQKLVFTKEASELMTTYGYRGNIRELENMFLHFFTFSNGKIDVADLPERVQQKKAISTTLAEAEKQHIIKILNIHRGNILQTATALGIARDTLKKKLSEYGMRD